ncbi:hypothetical protein CYG49_04145 [Candidatus Saccharibacteria bacterium]|nr:MAG: hypothetical protein CYG49_04145 [Candidatus Saccharibacteria bacterium]
MRKKIFVDLDRTLFDTDVFIAAVWHYLGKKYPIDTEVEKARAKQYYTYDQDLYNYHFFDHIRALAIGDVQTIRFELSLYLREQSLLYNDTQKGLAALKELGGATILTFGNEEYQRFKIACVPELAWLPVEIVQQHKRHFFSENYTQPCILIDDKDLYGQLPSTVEFIKIDRTQPRPIMDRGGYRSIRALANIREIVENEV